MSSEQIAPLMRLTERYCVVYQTPAHPPGFALEPQLPIHAEQMFEVLSDPAIYEYENEPPASVDWLRARFARLESRQSPDGCEKWLNWVIRLPSSELAGYVQAT